MKKRTINVGSRVAFISRNHAGRGTIAAIEPGATGPWYVVKTKDHPKGRVTVRASQVS